MTANLLCIFSVLGLALLFVSVDIATPSVVHSMEIEHRQPAAVADNCGDVPFNISWTPDVLSAFGSVVINVDYTFPSDFDGGSYNLSGYFHGDTRPFITYADNFECAAVSDYFSCPAKKGLHFKGSKKINDLSRLASFPGDYDAHLEVKNKQGQPMMCMKVHLVIKDG